MDDEDFYSNTVIRTLPGISLAYMISLIGANNKVFFQMLPNRDTKRLSFPDQK